MSLLQRLLTNPEINAQFIRDRNIKPMRMAVIPSCLAYEGRIKEISILKHRLEITGKGRGAVRRIA